MRTVKISFYDSFRCIADKCTDTCCAGWDVYIDEKALEKYNTLGGELGEKIRRNIEKDDEGDSRFILRDKNCPFLCGNGLCELISECGESILCDICSLHPRFFNEFPGVTEAGLGLCCEEVCRLLFENDVTFVAVDDGEEADDETAEATSLYDDFFAFRQELFKVTDEAGGINEAINKALDFSLACSPFSQNDTAPVSDDEGILRKYLMTEPIDEKWLPFVRDIYDNIGRITAIESLYDETTEKAEDLYAKLFKYIIFRNVSDSLYDGEVFARVRFCAEAVRFIKLCDMNVFLKNGTIGMTDRINNIKYWSQQIEYSDVNVDRLLFSDEVL